MSEDSAQPQVVPEAVQAPLPAAEVPSKAAASVELSTVQHPFTIGGRVVISKLLKSGVSLVGQTVTVGGWVKTGRSADKGAFAFLEVNDGSGPNNIQVIVPSSLYDIGILTSTGASVLVKGEVKEPPEGKKQSIELHVTEVLYVGPSDGKTYPVAKTKLTLEFMRSVIHFRIRTNTIAAITRIRSTLAAATHEFFQKNGFLNVHTPFITSSDCEGAGEMFQVHTLAFVWNDFIIINETLNQLL
jgi:asparaginyl-tRNA synthetase